MTPSAKPWLGAVPWESVVALNASFCQGQKLEPLPNDRGIQAARQLWEKSWSKAMKLCDAFRICHDACELAPFIFNNGNTFAAIGRSLIEEPLKSLPPVESQMCRNTIGHYIAGVISRKELLSVLQHLEPQLGQAFPLAPSTVPRTVAMPLTQEQRA